MCTGHVHRVRGRLPTTVEGRAYIPGCTGVHHTRVVPSRVHHTRVVPSRVHLSPVWYTAGAPLTRVVYGRCTSHTRVYTAGCTSHTRVYTAGYTFHTRVYTAGNTFHTRVNTAGSTYKDPNLRPLSQPETWECSKPRKDTRMVNGF